MRRISLIALLSFITLCCSAQMFVWKDGVVQYALRTSTADSITFYEPADYGEIHPVDLGLPSGIKWADKNLGATAPSEIGTRYAWGETETKETFTQENYIKKYCYIGNGNDETDLLDSEYNLMYELSSKLFLKDDPAHCTLAGNWRMPTKEEYQELLENCISELASSNGGVIGYRLTSENGNSISFNLVDCWSSSIEDVSNGRKSWKLANSIMAERPLLDGLGDPYKGYYIRPVYDESLTKTVAPSPFVFSVSANRYILFSKGNLQYQATTGNLRFASEQYDIIGESNNLINATYSGWIDLFEWGYGTNPGHVCSDMVSLDDNLTFIDWGTNSISNGNTIDPTNTWRTLNSEEWTYLLHERNNAEVLKATASVNGVFGLIILPDNWTLPNGMTFIPIEDNGTANQFSLNEWKTLENAGAIFLPAGGRRAMTEINKIQTAGFYWSSDFIGEYLEDHFMPTFLYIKAERAFICAGYNTQGFSVRLVKDYVE